MKLNKKIFIVLIIIVSFLFLLPSVKAFDDIEYDFEKDILFNETNPTLNLFNIREQQVYNGTYNSTWSFDNEIDGTTGTDIDFVDEGSSSHIVNNIDNHKKVLALNDISGNKAEIYNNFSSAREFGTIELWFYIGDVSETNLRIRPKALTSWGAYVGIGSTHPDYLSYYDGSWHSIVSLIDNTWYHLRIDFDCGDTGYEGLSPDNFFIYINSIKYGEYPFLTAQTELLQLGFVGNDEWSYIDGIGYSWLLETALYNFDDDIVGQEPEGWTSNNDASCTTEIISILDLRTKVLDLDDGNAAGKCEISAPINTLIGESIDFYIQVSSIGVDDTYITFKENDIDIIVLRLHEGDIDGYTTEGGWFQIGNSVISIDTWYVFTVELPSLWLGDQLRFLLDDVELVDHVDNENQAVLGIDEIVLFTDEFGSGDHTYYDNFDNFIIQTSYYTIGDNFKPLLEILEGFEGLLETDKYEFSLLDVNERASLGATSFGLWSFSDTGNGQTEINFDEDQLDIDRKIFFELGAAGSCNIKRTSLSITESLIDVNFGFEIVDSGSDNANFTVLLESSDESIITGFRIQENTNRLFYFDGTFNNILRNDIVESVDYDINLFLNYDIDTVRLEVIADNIFIENYDFEMVSTGKTGLFEIDCTWEKTAGGIGVLELDYIGVYFDGESLHGEIGLITTPINSPFHFERHYLYSIEATGKIHDGVVEGSYVVGEGSFQNILDDITIPSIAKSGLETFNIYDLFTSNISNANLVYTVFSSNISIDYINIEGSKMTEGSNEHFLIFSSGGLESMDNYFYVSDNHLRFTHNTSIDNVLEFIQAEFDIDDKTTVDNAISFSSAISLNGGFGFFRANLTDTSQIFTIDTSIPRTKRIILYPDEVLTSFIVLISDTNKNSIEGITEGQVSNIILLDVESAIVSIVSSNLITMLIPLIIIILPTLAISGTYGDFLVVPLFIFFSLILTITGLLPIWLAFIIFISSSLFIFFNKGKNEVS